MMTQNALSTPFDLDPNEKKSMDEIMNLVKHPEAFGRGAFIQAKVIDIDQEYVYLDIGGKQEGICSKSEFKEQPESGSEVEVVVRDSSADGPVRLSRKEAEQRIAWERIREAYESVVPLTGCIAKIVNYGYIVEVDGIGLFLPLSQSTSNFGSRRRFPIGKIIDFKILEINEKYKSAVISHKALIDERNDASWSEFLSRYSIGDEVEGTVSKIVSFGVIVKIGEIEALLHQSDISWKKNAKFKGKFKRGDTIRVKILNVDRDNNRLSVGIKQQTEDPWDWARRELKENAIIHGVVSSITNFGAFVEIKEGLEGMIHVSELSWEKKVKHPKKYLNQNQEIEVKILSIDIENKRISLGIRQLQTDPWETIADEVKVGSQCEGEVTAITKFGAFVKIKENVEGLIHFNDFTWEEKVDRSMLKKKEICKFKILAINPEERRISCGIKQLLPGPYEKLSKKYKKGAVIECVITKITSFGIFARLDERFEGLVHISKINLRAGEKLAEMFKKGDKIKTILQNIDVDARKISLSIKAFSRHEEQKIYNNYLKKKDIPSTSSLASLLRPEVLDKAVALKREETGTTQAQ